MLPIARPTGNVGGDEDAGGIDVLGWRVEFQSEEGGRNERRTCAGGDVTSGAAGGCEDGLFGNDKCGCRHSGGKLIGWRGTDRGSDGGGGRGSIGDGGE